jgi:hypothetical protein
LVTGVLGFDREFGLLMEEFQGKHLGTFEDYESWSKAISAYAKLQIACVDKTGRKRLSLSLFLSLFLLYSSSSFPSPSNSPLSS